jgi:hypothetical protein
MDHSWSKSNRLHMYIQCDPWISFPTIAVPVNLDWVPVVSLSVNRYLHLSHGPRQKKNFFKWRAEPLL